MRHKAGVQPVRENGNIPDTQPSYEMMSLKAELESARTELNRRTVVFSNHYTNMVEKWKTEKTKREVVICLIVCLFVYLFVCLFVCLFICLFVCLFIYLFIYLLFTQ